MKLYKLLTTTFNKIQWLNISRFNYCAPVFLKNYQGNIVVIISIAAHFPVYTQLRFDKII